MTLASCWGHFGQLEVPLAHLGPLLGPFWDNFEITLGVLWAHFVDMKAVLGHFGLALGSL